jgi:hypothetical protein
MQRVQNCLRWHLRLEVLLHSALQALVCLLRRHGSMLQHSCKLVTNCCSTSFCYHHRHDHFESAAIVVQLADLLNVLGANVR